MMHKDRMAEGDELRPAAVAARLVRLRQALKVGTQAEMAARLGITATRYNNYETGLPLARDVAIHIVRTFPGVTLDWLYLGKEEGLSFTMLQAIRATGENPSKPWGAARDQN